MSDKLVGHSAMTPLMEMSGKCGEKFTKKNQMKFHSSTDYRDNVAP